MVAYGVAECTGEGGRNAVDGDSASSGGELGLDEGCDVGVAEIVEGEVAESGDEVGGDVAAVADHRGRLQYQFLRFEPGAEVVGDSLVGVGGEAGGPSFEHPAQCRAGCLFGGVAASADGMPAGRGGGKVDSERPAAVPGVLGEQPDIALRAGDDAGRGIRTCGRPGRARWRRAS